MVKAKLKTRLITIFWSLVIMSIGGFIFQDSSTVGGIVVFGIGLMLFIGGIRGTTSFGIGSADHDWEDIDQEEYLQRLRSMPLKKRRKQISALMFMRQLSGQHDPKDEASTKFKQALYDIIKEDLKGLTEEEQKDYMKRITPDPKAVQLMESLKNLSSNEPTREPADRL